MNDDDCIFVNANGESLDPWCAEHRRSAICCLRAAKASAYKAEVVLSMRVPTQAEGDRWENVTHTDGFTAPSGECFVEAGGWTGRRCRECSRWVWGGPTICQACVD